jgi:hypothetical protein
LTQNLYPTDTNVRLTTEEMNIIDPERKAEAVHLSDGGYLSTFQVMHDLHCIVRLLSDILNTFLPTRFKILNVKNGLT